MTQPCGDNGNPIHVIGMGLSFQDLTLAHLDLIHAAQVLVGGRRHLEAFQGLPAIQREIAHPVSDSIDFIKENMASRRVVVLASGDPLFFGIGKTLIDHLGPDKVVVHPNVTTMASAFARLKLPWQEAGWVSLHGGKGEGSLGDALEEKDLLCLLTDPVNDPAAIAQILRRRHDQWDMWVLERLGMPDESITPVDVGRAEEASYAQPNVVVLRKKEPKNPPGSLCLGTPDHWFLHEKGLITKAEVRAVVLSTLRLEKDQIFWDLGAGSGSVALEASLFLSRGYVYAVEKEPDRILQIEANARRFGVRNLSAVRMEMPEGLDRLPRPHRVFVGGGGKHLAGILDAAGMLLNSGGRMVISSILFETLNLSLARLENMGWRTGVTQIQVNRSRQMPWGRRMESLNPVWIIIGEKGA